MAGACIVLIMSLITIFTLIAIVSSVILVLLGLITFVIYVKNTNKTTEEVIGLIINMLKVVTIINILLLMIINITELDNFIVAYLIGTFSMSYVISKISGINLKEHGSRNLGASNTLAIIGKRAGILVLICDVLKGLLAIYLVKYIGGDNIMHLAALGVVLGHIFPFYLDFKGGKGFATYLGVILALDYKFFIILGIVALSLAGITNYIVAATFTFIIVSPVYFICIGEYLTAFELLVTSLVILIKHKDNIVNLITRNGKEMKIFSAFGNKYKKASGIEDYK